MATRSGCIFCEGKPLTREHLFPVWVAEAIRPLRPAPPHPNAVYRLRNQRGKDFERVGDYWYSDAMTFVSRVVCGPCNNGWMSEIETRAKATLVAMIRDQELVLDLAAQEAVATWLALRAVVEQHSRSDPPSLRWAAEYFRRRKPPTAWQIRVGRYEGEAWHASYIGTTIEVRGTHPLSPFATRSQGFLFTVVIGHFLGQVVGLDTSASIPTNPVYFREIWPHPLLRISHGPRGQDFALEPWPPVRGFDDAQLKKSALDVMEPRIGAE